MSRRRRTRLAPNPFVAFADVTIAMSFIFAICSIALSKNLADMNRDDRQTKVQGSLVNVLRDVANAPIKTQPISDTDTDYNRRRNIEAKLSNGKVALRLWSNGSFQRIEIPGCFGRSGLAIARESYPVLKGLAKTIRQTMVSGLAEYVYFHGITERNEPAEYTRRTGIPITSRAMSVQRAQAVYDFFVRQGAIATDVAHARQRKQIDPRFAIDYGKAELYARSSKDDTGEPGRVDIIIFYSDK
jgi:hypothetical protein